MLRKPKSKPEQQGKKAGFFGTKSITKDDKLEKGVAEFFKNLNKTGTKSRHERRKAKAKKTTDRRPISESSATAGSEPKPYKIYKIAVDEIKVVGGRRLVDPKGVVTLVESFQAIGIQTPLTVTKVNGKIRLVAGFLRLEAAKHLKWKTVPCIYFRGGKTERRMWQIGENIHRTQLPPLEESAAIAKWVELWKTLNSDSEDDDDKSVGRPKGGVSAAARELPVQGDSDEAKRKAVARAIKIDEMEPEVKRAVREAGLNKKGAKAKLSKIAAQKTKKRKLDMVQKLARAPKKVHGDAAAEISRMFDLASSTSLCLVWWLRRL